MLVNLIKIPYLRFKYKYFPNKAQQFWAQELLSSKGISAKLGQIFAQGYKTELPKSSLKRKDAKNLFKNFFNKDITVSENILSASMGQVFFIKIENEEYALKILHPGIKKQILSEIDDLIFLGSYFAKAKKFNLEKNIFKNFLIEICENETDLNREADFQQRFFDIFQIDSKFKIPKPITKYSNQVLFCQEKVPSILAQDLITIPHFHIFDFFFRSLFSYNILHADLNDRNWGITKDDVTVIYDFGCAEIISERRIEGLKKLILNQDVISAFNEIGVRLEATYFKDKEQELRDSIFNSLLGEDIGSDWSISSELQEKYQDKIKILRSHSDPWVLLFMRSLFSLIKTYQSKKINIPLKNILTPYLHIKRKSMKATQIKVKVVEDDKEVVSLSLPITALDNLKELMPEKVLSRMETSKIDLKKIVQKVKDTEYIPQDLFCLSIDKRSYKVWID